MGLQLLNSEFLERKKAASARAEINTQLPNIGNREEGGYFSKFKIDVEFTCNIRM